MMTVGRSPECSVRVDDEYASPKHCAVRETDDGRFFVQDLGSTNGTWLERPGVSPFGEPQRQLIRVYDWTQILPGDTLIVGRSRLPTGNPSRIGNPAPTRAGS